MRNLLLSQATLPRLVLLLLLSVTVSPTTTAFSQGTAAKVSPIETSYDSVKDRTTVRLLPVKISGERDKYYSLHMSPSFSYPGRQPQTPSKIDFELQTVVKGRLKTDLYVVFIIDGEKIFLSSSRRGIKRPVPGRLWMGESLVFNMPFETLLKIAGANTLEIKMDAVRFEVGVGNSRQFVILPCKYCLLVEVHQSKTAVYLCGRVDGRRYAVGSLSAERH